MQRAKKHISRTYAGKPASNSVTRMTPQLPSRFQNQGNVQPLFGSIKRRGDACRGLPHFYPGSSKRSSGRTLRHLCSEFTGSGPTGATADTGTNRTEPVPHIQSIPKPLSWLRPPAQLDGTQTVVFAPPATPPGTQNPWDTPQTLSPNG